MGRYRRWIGKRRAASGGPGAETSRALGGDPLTPDEDTYSVTEAARILGLSSRRIRQMVEEGKLEAKRTSLGAFRLPGELVRQERRRRADTPKTFEQTTRRSELSPWPRPSTPSPGRGSSEVSLSGKGDGSEADDRRWDRDHPWAILGRRSSRLLVGFALAAALGAGLLIGLAHGGARSGATRGGPAGLASPSVPASAQRVVMLIDAPPLHGLRNPQGKLVDAFVPSDFTVRGGIPVLLTIFNYDDTPHTFTSPRLGVDALIPPARSGSPSSVTVAFSPSRQGVYRWRCRVPCDPWSMGRQGFMSGTVKVIAA